MLPSTVLGAEKVHDTVLFENVIALEHVEGVYPLLDQQQVGYLLLDPSGQVRHASFLAARLFGRRLSAQRLRDLLRDDWKPLCEEVLAGRSAGERWREVAVDSRDGGSLHVAVRSTAVRFPGGATGVLLSINDMSDVVQIHERYKELLGRLQAANQELRRQIDVALREHEDDLAQFNEILQVAPSIFASFLGEGEEAVALVRSLLELPRLDSDHIDAALRAAHTVKGNARALGLNFIAGRAHAVEELVRAARTSGRFGDDREAAVLIDDLGRAVERALSLRRRLGGAGEPEAASAATPAAAALDLLASARASLEPGHPAHALLAEAETALAPLGRVALGQLFEYLRATATAVAVERGLDSPVVDVDGGDLDVPMAIHRALQQALPHLVRNAVWHGLEPGAARRAAGKAAAGRIGIAARETADELTIEIRDDGRGIDRTRLRERAAELGLVIAGDDTVDDLIFHPGLSTAGGLSLDAGRGYGTAAARAAIEGLSGRIEVRSAPTRGTTFTIVVPRPSTRSNPSLREEIRPAQDKPGR